MFRSLIVMVLAAFVAVAAISSTELFSDNGRPSNSQLVSTAPVSEPVMVSDHSATENNRPAPNNSTAKKPDPLAATCSNPVITISEPTSIEFRNDFLVKAMKAFDMREKELGVTATAEERQDYVAKVAEAVPTGRVTENVFFETRQKANPFPDLDSDPNGVEHEKVKVKAKQRGCGLVDNPDGVQLVSYSAVAYDNSVGWKYCSKTVSFQALNGLTIGKLRLISEWYNNVYQVPQWIEARATGTAYYLWKTDGDEDLRIARPYYKYPSGVWYAYQNRAWQDFKYEISASIGGIGGSVILDTHTLYAAHIVGPGGKCV